MRNKNKQKGQAIVTLLFVMVIGLTVITAVVIVAANNLASGSSLEQGTIAYYAAEAGAENAIIRKLRDPSYSGEVLSVDGANVTISVNGDTITSVSSYGSAVRKIEVQTTYNNNILTVSSWKEIK